MRRLVPLLILGLLAACSRQQPSPAAAQPVFQPDKWFVGDMRSAGDLQVGFGKARALRVDSSGRLQPNGTVRLDQAIHWAGGSVDHRFWLMRRRPGGGYDVTLSDARGAVMLETQGARAHLRYRDRRGPLIVEQWMDLQPDGVTLANWGVVSLLGVPVGKLDETIVHQPF